MYKKPKVTDEQLGINPFLDNLEIRVLTKTIDGNYYKDDDGDWLPVEREMEYDPVCKLYADSKRRLFISKISPRGKDLMMWIMYEMEFGKDYVIINSERYMLESEIKAKNTYRDALNELIKKGIIQKTVKQSVFWINPRYIFKGDRPAKYPKHIKQV